MLTDSGVPNDADTDQLMCLCIPNRTRRRHVCELLDELDICVRSTITHLFSDNGFHNLENESGGPLFRQRDVDSHELFFMQLHPDFGVSFALTPRVLYRSGSIPPSLLMMAAAGAAGMTPQSTGDSNSCS